MTKWGPDSEKLVIPGFPAIIPMYMNDDQLRQYMRIIRIEEITQMLRTGNVFPEYNESRPRSPSPEPEYDEDMKRINTRDVRYRTRLEEERNQLIEEECDADHLYKPPADYRRTPKLNERIYIPVQDFPEINFMGLLIGPRGKYLQSLEQQAGVKISIRGRGAEKDRADARSNAGQEGMDDDLHALIMAENEENLVAGVKLVNEILEKACTDPESVVEMRRQQLVELAKLNGVNVDESGKLAVTGCQICGDTAHQQNQCPLSSDPDHIKKAEERSRKMEADYEEFLLSIGGQSALKGAVEVEKPVVPENVEVETSVDGDLQYAPWNYQARQTR
ncbi:hypothetical protein MIR68_006164 [Amoeboaphelidium protococcarum]|nr:hypothetical protein MIR68_006164 [Amoeboaphelidium protococcarum]